MEYKIFEMFAGYGGASFGLSKAGFKHKVVGFSEIEKSAIECYTNNHGDIHNYGDAWKIDEKEIPDFDILTGGFPCQTFSNEGKKEGITDKKGLLFNEIIRIAEHKQPKYMVLENVKGLTFSRNKEFFEFIKEEIDRIGYDLHFQVLNSSDYGIPQNRERIWLICIRKDLNQSFEFPQKEPSIKLSELLEENVSEQYDVPSNITDSILIETCSDHLKIVNKTKKGYLEAYNGDGVSLEFPNSKNRRGRVSSKSSSTLACSNSKAVVVNNKLRRLTPTEYFRLMGFTKDEIILDGISESKQYKLAGNGWEINVVSKIFKQLLHKEIDFDIMSFETWKNIQIEANGWIIDEVYNDDFEDEREQAYDEIYESRRNDFIEEYDFEEDTLCYNKNLEEPPSIHDCFKCKTNSLCGVEEELDSLVWELVAEENIQEYKSVICIEVDGELEPVEELEDYTLEELYNNQVTNDRALISRYNRGEF